MTIPHPSCCFTLLILLSLPLLASTKGSSQQQARPSIILTSLFDDFGYASASFNRPPNSTLPEMRTPNIDTVAHAGIILNRHYVHSFCSPTRSSVLSARLPVHVQSTNNQPDSPNAGIPVNMTTISERFRELQAPVDMAVVGKWDVGGAAKTHTPEGREFNSSLIYFSHAIDAFTQNDYCGPSAHGVNRSTDPGCTCGDQFVDLWDTGVPSKQLNGTAFADDIFLERVLTLIRGFDASSGRSLWIHWTPHATHDPLQAPPSYLQRLNYTTNDESYCNGSIAVSATAAVYPGAPNAPTDYHCRRTYEAMTSWLDDAVGSIYNTLQSTGLWDSTLWLASSDNGGQNDLVYGGGSNLPLRGGKGSNWEGGIRVAAFASGGFLPEATRGTVEEGLTHGVDWGETICTLLVGGEGGGGEEKTGVQSDGHEGGNLPARISTTAPTPTTSTCLGVDARAAAAGLPQYDSVNLWPLLSGANTTSPRTEIPVGPGAIVTSQYKLLLGNIASASWGGDIFPNASSPVDVGASVNCGTTGCLYDLQADPSEHFDLAKTYPLIAANLKARLSALTPGFYTNNEGKEFVCIHNASLPIGKPCACNAAEQVYGGYFGYWAKSL